MVNFGTKRSPLMNGGPASHRPPFLSNACFVSQTLVNPLSINFRIVSKLGGRSDGLLVSCTSFAKCGPTIMKISIKKRQCLVSEFKEVWQDDSSLASS